MISKFTGFEAETNQRNQMNPACDVRKPRRKRTEQNERTGQRRRTSGRIKINDEEGEGKGKGVKTLSGWSFDPQLRAQSETKYHLGVY
jgi:hypothetical protein